MRRARFGRAAGGADMEVPGHRRRAHAVVMPVLQDASGRIERACAALAQPASAAAPQLA
jgi:hypothetical protein